MYCNSKYVPILTSNCYKIIIVIPDSIQIKIKEGGFVYVLGKLGELNQVLHKSIDAKIDNNKSLLIYTRYSFTNSKALIGTTRSLIKGMIVGVTSGFLKKLQLIGIGYRASIENNIISLVIGFSHVIYYKLPIGIAAECLNQTEIILSGINKQLIGQVAADLRAIRPPEPFKGKGIRYVDEIVRNKDTKKR